MNRICALLTVVVLWGAGAAHPTRAADTSNELPGSAPVSVAVRLDQPLHRLAGGLGASWHALRREVPFDLDGMTPGRRGAPQGSAFGGNPPLENTAAWQDLERHFRWLGPGLVPGRAGPTHVSA